MRMYEKLPYDVEAAIVDIIVKEVQLSRRLEDMKRALELCREYNSYTAFR